MNPRDHTIEHLNRILTVMTFQNVLFDIALSHRPLESIAEQVGIRRETIWRYKTGTHRAPFKILLRIMGVIGAKFIVVSE
jgi:DNA-binding phage protein